MIAWPHLSYFAPPEEGTEVRRQLILVVALLLSVGATVAAAPILNPDNISATTLDNGLRVIVKSERQWPVVAIGLVIRAGSGYESADNSGVAHMVEHLLFEERSNEEGLGPWIENMGGYINGMATRDFTQVTVAASSQYTDQIIPKLAQSVFAAKLTAEAVAHQRSIISRELADRLTTTSALAELFTWKIAFTEHPYGHPVPGEPDQVKSLGIEAVQSFYNAFYHPNNAALVAVGDVRPDDFFALAKQAFGAYPSGQLPDPPAPEPPQTEVRSHIEYLEDSSTLLEWAWHGPGIAAKREVCAMDLIYVMLSNELESMTRDAGEDNLLEAVAVNYLTQRWPGLFTITAVTQPAHELDLRSAILEMIDQLRTTPVSDEVIAEAKQAIYADYAFSNEAYIDQVDSLAFYEAIDSYQFAVDYIDLINQITPQQVQQTAQKYLGIDNYSLVIIRPKRTAEGAEEAWLR